jgi:hypothetical protein
MTADLDVPALWQPVEPLTEALFRVRMHGVFYSWTQATEPAAIDMPRLPDCLSFHVVTVGDVWIDVDGLDPVRLRPGDVALVPRGLGHSLASDLDAPSRGRVDELPQDMVSEHYSVLRLGPLDRPVRTAMLCGIVGFDSPEVHEVLQLLPPLIHLRAGEGGLEGRRAGAVATRRGGRHHAARRRPRRAGHPGVAGERAGRRAGLARGAARSVDRAERRLDPSGPGTRLDPRRPRRRGDAVAIGVRRAVHAPRGRLAHAVRHDVADESRGQKAP